MRSPGSRERRAAFAFVVLAAVVIGAVVQLVKLGGDEAQTDARSGSTVAKTAPATTTTTSPTISYQVQRGDTLTGIARRFGVPIAVIVIANQLADLDHVAEGQTLLIPPAPPVGLVVTPASITAGESVELQLTGAQPSESVTFEIQSPNGVFTGSPHVAPSDGTVTASYTPARDAPAGTYIVTARGDQGSVAQASLAVRAASP